MKKITCMTRRNAIRQIAEALGSVQKGYKSAARGNPVGVWSKSFAKASELLSKAQGGSKVNLAPTIEALKGEDWAKAQKAMASAAKAWCKWAEGQYECKGVPGWEDHQKGRIERMVDVSGWKPKAYEPKAKAPAKKAKRKAGRKPAAKQQNDSGDVMLALLGKLVDGQDKLAETMDKLVEAVS